MTGAGRSVIYFSLYLNSRGTIKADGVVRLYRNYDPVTGQGPVQMVSAFRGLNEVVQMKKGSGLIMDWKQSGGTLLVGGDSRIIRVWDAHTEDQVMVRMFIVHRLTGWLIKVHQSGFGHKRGQLCHVYDVRLRFLVHIRCRFRRWKCESLRSTIGRGRCCGSFIHGPWIVGAERPVASDPTESNHQRKVCSVLTFAMSPVLTNILSSVNGEVKLWDLRGSDRAVQTWNVHPNGIAAFDVHPQTGIFAA